MKLLLLYFILKKEKEPTPEKKENESSKHMKQTNYLKWLTDWLNLWSIGGLWRSGQSLTIWWSQFPTLSLSRSCFCLTLSHTLFDFFKIVILIHWYSGWRCLWGGMIQSNSIVLFWKRKRITYFETL